jgi:hypothetical protein
MIFKTTILKLFEFFYKKMHELYIFRDDTKTTFYGLGIL